MFVHPNEVLRELHIPRLPPDSLRLEQLIRRLEELDGMDPSLRQFWREVTWNEAEKTEEMVRKLAGPDNTLRFWVLPSTLGGGVPQETTTPLEERRLEALLEPHFSPFFGFAGADEIFGYHWHTFTAEGMPPVYIPDAGCLAWIPTQGLTYCQRRWQCGREPEDIDIAIDLEVTVTGLAGLSRWQNVSVALSQETSPERRARQALLRLALYDWVWGGELGQTAAILTGTLDEISELARNPDVASQVRAICVTPSVREFENILDALEVSADQRESLRAWWKWRSEEGADAWDAWQSSVRGALSAFPPIAHIRHSCVFYHSDAETLWHQSEFEMFDEPFGDRYGPLLRDEIRLLRTPTLMFVGRLWLALRQIQLSETWKSLVRAWYGALDVSGLQEDGEGEDDDADVQ